MEGEDRGTRWGKGSKGRRDGVGGYAAKQTRGKGLPQINSAAANGSTLRVEAAPGPGRGVTRALLKERVWDMNEGRQQVLEFYGDRGRPYGCFSNFFTAPFEFVVPEEFCGCALSLEERTVTCDFSEKAIMLCKAAAMGDSESYRKIAASKAAPAAVKRMGREVQHFQQDLWETIECSVAFEAVYQKFRKVEHLQVILLATDSCVIAEATSNDQNWGTGLDVGDKRNQYPAQWQGTNMLGWALMETRKQLRGTDSAFAVSETLENSCNSCETSSGLQGQEKAFLKTAKKVRDILKLEDASVAGTALDKMQVRKLESKHEIFLELSGLEKDLPPDSDVRTKNEDVLLAVATYIATNT